MFTLLIRRSFFAFNTIEGPRTRATSFPPPSPLNPPSLTRMHIIEEGAEKDLQEPRVVN